MGGVAGASGEGPQLTGWAFSSATISADSVGFSAVVVWLTQPAAAVRPAVADTRSAVRRRALAPLVRQRLGLDADPTLIAGPDGVRRLIAPGWFASVAERHGWVAAVIAPAPVGIDVETVAEAERSREVILADATVDDLAAWHGLAGVWAAREAVLKAVGRDLTRDPGGWRFVAGYATATGIAAHRVDLVTRATVVAAVAYAGS